MKIDMLSFCYRYLSFSAVHTETVIPLSPQNSQAKPNYISVVCVYSKRYKCGGGFYIVRSTLRSSFEFGNGAIVVIVIAPIVSLDSSRASGSAKKPSPNETSFFEGEDGVGHI